jgi:hypothetical protein
MFEGVGVGYAGAPWVLDDGAEPPPLSPTRHMPDGFMHFDPEAQALLDGFDRLAEEEFLAALPPAELWAYRYGTSAVPAPGVILGETSQAAAASAQHLAVQATRIRTIADAHRIAALLTAYEQSIEDLQLRFGAKVGDPNGTGGQMFARTFGLLTKAHPKQVTREVHAARTLRDRLPATWAVFQHGEASWSRVQTAAGEADGLDPEHWPAYDRAAAGLVVSSDRLKSDLKRERERLQDDTAAERARTTHERRRTSLELGHDSGVAFVIEGLATSWVPVNDALHAAAVAAHGTDPRGRTIAQLRHDIALDILTDGLRHAAEPGDGALVPHRKPVAVSLILTVPALSWLGRSKEPAQLSGYGPIAMELAKSLAGTANSFIRVLTHPFTGARLAMDRKVYSPPADLARWVRIRDGRSRFPGSTTPAHLSDIDHAREWQHGGSTQDTNLVTLDRPSHTLKSLGLFQEQYLDTGVVGITDAWGHWFEDPPNQPLDPAAPDLLPPADDDVTPF